MPHEIIMPVLGMNQDTGSIASWNKKPGDAVEVGDVIMDVETDKAVMEIEAKQSGFLSKVYYEAGSEVPVGEVVAIIDDSTAEIDTESLKVAPQEEKAPAPKQKKTPPKEPSPMKHTQTATVIPLAVESVLASPKAKALAQQYGIALKTVAKHCDTPVIHAADVERYMAEQSTPAIDSMDSTNATHVNSLQTCHITVTSPTEGLKECERWLSQQEDNSSQNVGHLLATLAASLMRKYQLYQETSPFIIKVDSWNGKMIQSNYICDPDLGRFSALEVHETIPTSPHLHVLYLRGSHITALSIDNSSIPTILVNENNGEFNIHISGFGLAQLSELTQFAEHLAQATQQPLLNLA